MYGDLKVERYTKVQVHKTIGKKSVGKKSIGTQKRR